MFMYMYMYTCVCLLTVIRIDDETYNRMHAAILSAIARYARRSLGYAYVGHIFDDVDLNWDNNPDEAALAFPVHEPTGILAVTDLMRLCLFHPSSDIVADIDALRQDRREVATATATAIQSLAAQHMVMTREMSLRSRSFLLLPSS